MRELVCKSLAAYLLGTLLGSLVLGRAWGVDIRRLGSGNAGATNAVRTVGPWFGLAVFAFDAGKGLLATALLPRFAAHGAADPYLKLACGGAVILGHVYPLWFRFRGGKGVATLIGVLGALDVWLLLPFAACWLAVVLTTGYAGFASVCGMAGVAASTLRSVPPVSGLPIFCFIAAAFVMFTHRANLLRMRQGIEPRARLWLFRPRSSP